MGFITKSMKVNHTNQISDGIITGAKLASSGIITSATQINDGVVTGTKLANDTITADKIAILDYVRSLQYDVYDDNKTDVKAVIDHDQATNNVRLRSGNTIATQNDVFFIASINGPAALKIGGGVSVLNMSTKRIVDIGAPVAINDALRFGQAEIRDAEISASANIAKSKLALGSPQQASGVVTASGSAYFDITGLITPSSYPALAIGYARLSSFKAANNTLLMLRDQSNNVLIDNVYGYHDDSGVFESSAQGVSNMVSALVTSGSVKLTHNHASINSGQTVYGTLMVIEL